MIGATGSMVLGATFLIGVVLGFTNAAAQIDTSAPEVDALLRSISFSPWGAVMLYIALNVRKAAVKMSTDVDELRKTYKEHVAAQVEMTKAVRERTEAERLGTAANSSRGKSRVHPVAPSHE